MRKSFFLAFFFPFRSTFQVPNIAQEFPNPRLGLLARSSTRGSVASYQIGSINELGLVILNFQDTNPAK